MHVGRTAGELLAGGPESAREQVVGLEGVVHWRRRMLERALWAAWLALSLAWLTLLREALSVGGGRWLVFGAISCAWTVIGMAAVWRALDLRLRGAALYVGFAIACAVTVSHSAYYGPNGYLGLATASVLLALGLGVRAGWLALVTSTLMLLAIAALFVTARVEMTDAALLEVRDASNWARVIVIFVGLSSAIVACASYLTARLERAMLRTQALLDALAVESQHRLDALERQHALSRQLQHAQKLEAVGTLAGGVAHDFNNLLLVIINHAGLLRRAGGRDPAELDASMRAIEDAAGRGSQLTRQLLAFGRGQAPVDRSTLDLDAAVTRSLVMIRSLLPASIEVRFAASGRAIAVRGAQVELDQIVMNLCVNARDAMPDGGALHVTTSLAMRECSQGRHPHGCITVRDTGTGMSRQEQERIFDPFYTTKPPDRGTGLGLSVVHGIVARWSGRIEVTSELGNGTELRVYLPCTEPDELLTSSDLGAGPAPGGSETVLLVDDDARVRRVTEILLAEAGYRVIACADGLEALECLRATPRAIDLVLTDMVMPRMGGRELRDATEQERPALPFLVCSGYAADAVTADFIVPSRCEFLQKPYTSEELLSRVRGLLDAAVAATGRQP
jgi:signal transduction histidine kinase/CheY-like chemotaxis protein